MLEGAGFSERGMRERERHGGRERGGAALLGGVLRGVYWTLKLGHANSSHIGSVEQEYSIFYKCNTGVLLRPGFLVS